MRLPAPRLIEFYNGIEEQLEETILRLSDSFPEGAVSDIEVTVRMINVNYGNNKELMKACKPLEEYSWLVAEIRKNNETKDKDGTSSAIDKAITAMPDDFLIKPFLEAHRAEVKGMLMEEYNEAEVLELTREEGKEEGRKEGRKEGQLKMLIMQSCRKLRKGKNASQIAEELEEDLPVIQDIVFAAADFAPGYDPDAIFALMISKKGSAVPK